MAVLLLCHSALNHLDMTRPAQLRPHDIAFPLLLQMQKNKACQQLLSVHVQEKAHVVSNGYSNSQANCCGFRCNYQLH